MDILPKRNNDIKKNQDYSPDTGNLFQSLGIRCTFCCRYQVDGIVFNHRHLILFGLCFILFRLFLDIKSWKKKIGWI